MPGRSAGRPDNFYPRPPRGGRQVCRAEAPAGQIISIHALREEGDAKKPANLSRIRNFYPRPPRGGRRPAHSSNTLPVQFLSTPSARRATRQRGPCRHHRSISIHALREEGDSGRHAHRGQLRISIHALREEGDSNTAYQRGMADIFLSTPSARRATLLRCRMCL